MYLIKHRSIFSFILSSCIIFSINWNQYFFQNRHCPGLLQTLLPDAQDKIEMYKDLEVKYFLIPSFVSVLGIFL